MALDIYIYIYSLPPGTLTDYGDIPNDSYDVIPYSPSHLPLSDLQVGMWVGDTVKDAYNTSKGKVPLCARHWWKGEILQKNKVEKYAIAGSATVYQYG